MTPKQREIALISERIAQAIAQHKLPPGSRLVEAQLVEAFDANRNHVQAALQRLALQHIVSIQPNRGAMVAQPTAQEAREVFVARRAIERAIVEQISPQAIAQHDAEITAHLACEKEAAKGEDRQVIVRELCRFHILLAEVSGNTVLLEILKNLMTRSSLIVALYQRNDTPSCQADEHAQIINALAKGEQQKAADLMLEHLDEIEGQLELKEGITFPDDLKKVFS